jgi:hypothetical protein
MQKQARRARYVRWLYELLLSAYYALVFMTTEDGYYLNLRVRLPVPLLKLTRGVFSSDPSFNLQYLWWFLLAGIIFVVLRILGQIRPLTTFLCQLVGSAVFLAPIFGGMSSWWTRPGWWWLLVEGVVAAAAAVLYANRRSPARAAFLATAVLFHFGLWSFVYFRNIHWSEYWNWAAEAVLLPLLGSLAWSFYVWLLARPDPTR